MIAKRHFATLPLVALLAVGPALVGSSGCSDPGTVAVAEASATAKDAAPMAASEGKTYTLTVEGMSCAVACAPKVEEALKSIEGVRSVNVDFESKTATVEMAPESTLDTATADKSFGNSGYFISNLAESDGGS